MVRLSTFLDTVVSGFRDYLGNELDVDGTNLAMRVRRYGVSPHTRDPEDNTDPPYEIIVSISRTDVLPEDYDFTGNLVLDTVVEAWCIRRLGAVNYNESVVPIARLTGEADTPLDDAHKFLYWARYTMLAGMRELPLDGTCRVERVVLEDDYGNIEVDPTRIIYRAVWNVKLNYGPESEELRVLPPLLEDEGFGDELMEIHIDREIQIGSDIHDLDSTDDIDTDADGLVSPGEHRE